MSSLSFDAIQAPTTGGSVGIPRERPKTLDGADFGDWLDRSIQAVNHMQHEANTAAQKLANGTNKDIHGTMIAMEKAGIAMSLMLEVRNKLISAYDEIKRMQF